MTDYTSWHVGMKVVCVDDQFDHVLPREIGPVAGREYTIRTISRCPNTGVVGIRVEEIVNPNTGRNPDDAGNNERGFPAPRFRPVQKRKTSIEIFQRLLTDPHVRIEEDA
jgi:hypothetical protein